MDIVASNKQIYLRKLQLNDAAFIHALLNQEAWLHYIGDRQIHSIADAQSYLKTGPLQSYEMHGFGLYLVVRTRDNRALGMSGFLQRSYLPAPDLGFAISEDYYRQGIGYEAGQLAMSLVGTLVNATCIYATVKEQNFASAALLTKLGFQRSLYAKEADMASELADLHLYQIAVKPNAI